MSLRFTLRSLVFQIFEVWGFPLGYNGELKIFGKKSLNIGNSIFKKFPGILQEFTGMYCLRTQKWVWSTAGYNSNVFIRITVVCYYRFTVKIISLHNTLTSLDSFFLLDISPIKVIYLNILGFFQ